MTEGHHSLLDIALGQQYWGISKRCPLLGVKDGLFRNEACYQLCMASSPVHSGLIWGSIGHFVSVPPLENDGNLVLLSAWLLKARGSWEGKSLSTVSVTDAPVPHNQLTH